MFDTQGADQRSICTVSRGARRRAAALCCLLSSVLGCSDDALPEARAGVVIRDSAGVTIVESSEGAWDAESTWSVDPAPRLHIGDGASGVSERQFAYIGGVHRLPGGAISVLDPWTPALSFFDSTGAYLGRFDRQGDGPGEFAVRSQPRSFTCGTDTVYVVTRQRVSAFVPPGTFVRTMTIDPPARVWGCTQGRIVAERAFSGWATTPGVRTDSSTLEWYDLSGVAEAVFDTLPSQDRAWSDVNGSVGFMPALFGSALSVATSDRGIATGWPEGFQIEIRDTTGSVRRVYRASELNRSVSSEDVDRFRGFVFNPWRGNAREQEELEERLRAAPGQRMPAFAQLLWSSDGHLWARRYDHLDAIAFFDYSRLVQSELPEFADPRHWEVFDPNGAYLGSVETPPRFTAYEVGPDWILGVWRDELDISYVRIYSVSGR